MRSSASVGRPPVNAIQARFCSAHASPRRSPRSQNAVERLGDLRLGLVELAPEHRRHAPAPQRVGDTLRVAELAPLLQRAGVGGVGAPEVAFLLLEVGEERERAGSGGELAGARRLVVHRSQHRARLGELAPFESRPGRADPQAEARLLVGVERQDRQRLVVVRLRPVPRLDELGTLARDLQHLGGPRPQVGRDAIEHAELDREPGRDGVVVGESLDRLVGVVAVLAARAEPLGDASRGGGRAPTSPACRTRPRG